MFPTQAIIDRQALRHNFRFFKKILGTTLPVPVIKSDAYGHGAVEAANIFAAEGAEQFAVFRIEEALALRNAQIKQPLWILLGALPDEIDQALGQNFKLAIWSYENAVKLNAAAAARNIVQDIHIKVDTGMGRLGVLPQELPVFLQKIAELKNLRITGVFSHFAKADDPCHPTTNAQLGRFLEIQSLLPAECVERHFSATCAIAKGLMLHLPYARPGISLYGITPEDNMNLDIKPAMTFASRLISVKDLPAGYTISYNCTVTLQRPSRIAVVPVGYSSGLPRALTNRCEALVRGKRVKNLGTICMDMTMFDVTDVDGAAVDDEIVLIGRQGEQEITAWDVAKNAGTIPYEIICGIGATQPRVYIH